MMRERYDALDGLRAVAALCVVAFHFGRVHGLQIADHGYLAVDFFFVLSGFVVAKAYGAKIGRSLTLGGFIRLRLIRLYPTAIVGVALGAVLMPINYPGSLHAPEQIASAIVAGVVLLVPIHSTISGEQFVVDGPLWSLSTELWANLGFAVLAKRSSLPVWFAVMGSAGIIFVSLSAMMGSFEIGSQQGDYGAALARTAFSFSYGVVLAKLCIERRVRRSGSATAVMLAVALAVILVGVPRIAHLNRAFDLLCVGAVLPAIVALCSSARIGPMTQTVARRLGALSYPLYVFHAPLLFLAAALTTGQPRPVALVAGVASVLVALAVSTAALMIEPAVRERLSGSKRSELPAATLP